MSPAVSRLLARGVLCPHPDSLHVGEEVDPSRIAPGVILHPGCRITGSSTSIGPGCVIGAEGPATVDGCQLAARVQLKGGFFAGSVFWDGVEVGSGAHIRPGCLLEEESSAAHTVGLKQTILFPFVTLGSLINFCDVLMAGGTSRKDHGEVGSSYVHFNFTPHQDKATASLIGDVPRGVMLDQPPVFLGGQGGLVGPRRIAFGTLLAAGSVCRTDVADEGRLVVPLQPAPAEKPYDVRRYGPILDRVTACVEYLGQIRALEAWYRHARPALVPGDAWHAACVEGGLAVLASVWKERVARLAELAGRLPDSIERLRGDHPSESRARREQVSVRDAWPAFERGLHELAARPLAAHALTAAAEGDYVARVRALAGPARAAAIAWLEQEAGSVVAAFRPALPEI